VEAPQLTDADVAVLARLPNVAAAVPRYSGDYTAVIGMDTGVGQVIGTTPAYLRPDQRVVLGRFLTARDLEERARVVVLGWQAALEAFPDRRPLGRRIEVLGLSFTVIGVLEPGGPFTMDNRVVLPISTVRDRLYPDAAAGQVQVTEVTLYLRDPAQLTQTEAMARDLLRRRHGLRLEQGNDFSFQNFREITETSNNILLGITAFLGLIGGIALLVGGIGITNIMLVSVTERTQEIGLRKAVGARRRDILLQFLIEAVVLSLVGGLGGLLVSALIIQLGAIAVQVAMNNGELATALTLDSGAVALALAFAAAVGLAAGMYPALRASRLSPITALRYN
jgi:putative ABC transport system permease protein